MGSVVLINPPLIDPTTAPHSLAYLVGAANHNRCGPIDVIDANIECLNSVFTPSYVQNVLDYRDFFISSFDACLFPQYIDALRYKLCVRSSGLTVPDVMHSLNIVRDHDLFYNYQLYIAAIRIISSYLSLITAPHYPYSIGFHPDFYDLYGSFDQLSDLCNDDFIDVFCAPFRTYFDALFDRLITMKPNIIGISANYTSQLPYMLHLLRGLRTRGCAARLVIGGTEVTDIYKNIKDKETVWYLFGSETLLVVGEGESAFVEIALTSTDPHPVLRHGNIITKSSTTLGSPLVEDINAIGIPDYSIFKWNDYWSPEPVILFSPTRGCYWNRCTFCDYGLNFDLPASPSRQLLLPLLESSLVEITKFSRCIYFAVDVIAPSFLRRIAHTIKSQGYNISWGAEIRLEHKLAEETAIALLKDGGCVSLSFGYESGSPRILELIDKGIRLEYVPQLIRMLSRFDIKVQMMGFLGFPSEGIADVRETLSFLSVYSDYWIIAELGHFVLTPGAIVAKQPERFGIATILTPNRDIVRTLSWPNASSTSGHDRDFSRLRQESALSLNPFFSTRFFGRRPFLGGIDTAHSILYFKRFSTTELRTMTDPGLRHSHIVECHCAVANILDFPDTEGFAEISAGLAFVEKCALLKQPYWVDRQKTDIYIKNYEEIYIKTGCAVVDSQILGVTP